MIVLDARQSNSRGGGPSFTLQNRLVRLLWRLTWLAAASWTPPSFRVWRRFLLRLFGAKLGHGADVRGSARVWLPSHLEMGDRAVIGPGVDCYNQAPIVLGEDALVSQRVYLCAGSHDVDDPHFQLIARPIRIGRHVWIAAEAFVGPGADIGDRAVLGARAVAFGWVEADMIYAGNPARPLRARCPGTTSSERDAS